MSAKPDTASAALDDNLAPNTAGRRRAGMNPTPGHATLLLLHPPDAGEPDALKPAQQGALLRAAARRGPRDGAIIAVLLYAGPRVAECEHLDLTDVAITARTGSLRLLGKGDQPRSVPLPARAGEKISTWLDLRGREPGPLWLGQRGRLTASGITQVVLATGKAVELPGLRPHRLRHSYATRLRQGGADPAQIQALLGHASLETAGRYFRELSGIASGGWQACRSPDQSRGGIGSTHVMIKVADLRFSWSGPIGCRHPALAGCKRRALGRRNGLVCKAFGGRVPVPRGAFRGF